MVIAIYDTCCPKCLNGIISPISALVTDQYGSGRKIIYSCNCGWSGEFKDVYLMSYNELKNIKRTKLMERMLDE